MVVLIITKKDGDENKSGNDISGNKTNNEGDSGSSETDPVSSLEIAA